MLGRSDASPSCCLRIVLALLQSTTMHLVQRVCDSLAFCFNLSSHLGLVVQHFMTESNQSRCCELDTSSCYFAPISGLIHQRLVPSFDLPKPSPRNTKSEFRSGLDPLSVSLPATEGPRGPPTGAPVPGRNRATTNTNRAPQSSRKKSRTRPNQKRRKKKRSRVRSGRRGPPAHITRRNMIICRCAATRVSFCVLLRGRMFSLIGLCAPSLISVTVLVA